MGALLKQDAVNQVLVASGETMVNSLLTDTGVDTSVAEFMLDQVTMDWQLRGLAENEVISYYVPDSDNGNKIVLKQGTRTSTVGSTIYAELLSTHWTAYDPNGRPQQRIMAIIRHDASEAGGNANYKPILYNITEDTSAWVDPISWEKYEVLERQKLSWGDMNTSIQQGIVDQTARDYQMLTTGDGDVDRLLAHREEVSRMRARAADISHKQRNLFVGGDSAVRRATERHTWGSRANDNARKLNW